MSKPACDYLSGHIDKALRYCRKEFDMSYAEAVGVLQILIVGLVDEMREKEEEEYD